MVVSVTVTLRTDPTVFSCVGMEVSESVCKAKFSEVFIEGVFPIFKECIARHVVRFQEVQVAAYDLAVNLRTLKSGFQSSEKSLLSLDLNGARVPCGGIHANDLNFCSMG